jgi:hypothetical protein
VEFQEYDDMLRRLIIVAEHQRTINDDLRSMLSSHDQMLRQHDAIIERLTAAIERLDVTQARIETLLARMVRGSGNGREA